MKIIRHTARDMRQAMRAVREQLGEDAVIRASKRTNDGVEVTAAVDFDASTLEAGGFSNAPAAAPAAPAVLAAAAREIAAPAPQAIASPAAQVTPSPAAPPATPAPRALSRRRLLASRSALATSRAAAESSTATADEASSLLDARPTQSYDSDCISAAAREAVAAHARALSQPPVAAQQAPSLATPAEGHTDAMERAVAAAPTLSAAPARSRTELPVYRSDEVIERARASSLAPFGAQEGTSDSGMSAPAPELEELTAPRVEVPAGSPTAEAMGNELKSLRRMLETQLAHLAWNDLTRRAPIRTEILRELTEIGITHDLAEHLVRQLPEDTDLTFARRFTIAGLSQYLRVTGDRWLDEGGRVAFAGATGVGKTTTLAKVAVRWVLRHGPRDLALVAADPVRIGAQDQLRSLAQLLGVAVYSPDQFENLPSLL